MTTDLEQTVGASAGDGSATTVPTASVGTPSIDPAEYQQLQSQIAEYQRAFGALEPVAGIVKDMLENPEERQYVEQSLGYYRKMRTENQQLSPEYQALQKHFDDQLAPIRTVAEQVQKSQQFEFHQRQTRAQQELTAYFQPVVDADPSLKANVVLGQAAKIAMDLAVNENISFKDAADRLGLSQVLPKREARKLPPTASRGDAGLPGIPQSAQSPAYTPSEGKAVSIKDAFLATYNRQRGKAS